MSGGIRFRDPAQQQAFDENGYVICRMMSASAAAALITEVRDQYGERLHNNQPDMVQSNVYSTFDPDADVRARFDALLKRALEPGIEQTFADWKCVDASCVVKVSNGGHTPLHQDYANVDTPFGHSMLIWCALDHTTRENGCLHVVPGSHRLYRHIRSMGSCDSFGEHGNALSEKYGIDIELGPGEAVVTDLSIWHRAWPNQSGQPRFAVLSNVCSPDVRPATYLATDDGGAVAIDAISSIQLYEFLKNQVPIVWTDDQILHRLPPWSKRASRAQLEALLLARGPRATIDYDPLETVAHLADPPPCSAPSRPPEPRWRSALRQVPGTVSTYRALRNLTSRIRA